MISRRPRYGQLIISRPMISRQASTVRVAANVAGEPLWFESDDVPLEPVSEAFGSAILFAAATHGAELNYESSPCPVWTRNSRQALEVARQWWGYPVPARHSDPLPPPTITPEHKPGLLCFTGGVDSFHSLLRGGHEIRTLVFVQGYDVPLADLQRARECDRSVRTVAAACGVRAATLRTNLRVHRATHRTDWAHIHGGALAAVGHLLSREADQLLISASYPFALDHPWGSHWRLDPWWSSAHMTIRHVGAERWRAQKLEEIADEPLVHQHLRVCWEHRGPASNCGRCEKCLRTMLILASIGKLEAFRVFPPTARLAAALDDLPRIRSDLHPVYRGFLDRDLDPAASMAVERLLDRSLPSETPAKPTSWWRSFL